jgi:hypothetical protein
MPGNASTGPGPGKTLTLPSPCRDFRQVPGRAPCPPYPPPEERRGSPTAPDAASFGNGGALVRGRVAAPEAASTGQSEESLPPREAGGSDRGAPGEEARKTWNVGPSSWGSSGSTCHGGSWELHR